MYSSIQQVVSIKSQNNTKRQIANIPLVSSIAWNSPRSTLFRRTQRAPRIVSDHHAFGRGSANMSFIASILKPCRLVHIIPVLRSSLNDPIRNPINTMMMSKFQARVLPIFKIQGRPVPSVPEKQATKYPPNRSIIYQLLWRYFPIPKHDDNILPRNFYVCWRRPMVVSQQIVEGGIDQALPTTSTQGAHS